MASSWLSLALPSITGVAQTADLLANLTKQQIAVLLRDKAARTPAQRKMNTQLIFAARQRSRGIYQCGCSPAWKLH